jgi:selenocysteine lyase/cysteine desulfurase
MLRDLDAYRRTLLRRSRCLDEWLERFDAMHTALEGLLEAPAQSVFRRDTATATHAAIASAVQPAGARRGIVTSSADFHSTRYVWHAQVRAASRS